MVRPEVIQKRLEKVEEYLAILKKIRKYSREEFLADPERYGSAERFLQLTIEALGGAIGAVVFTIAVPGVHHQGKGAVVGLDIHRLGPAVGAVEVPGETGL